MKSTTKAEALVPAIKHIGQGLVLLALLALLGLVGTGVSHAHAASAPSGVRIAGTNGNIHIGGATAPAPDSKGIIHIGG